MPMRKRKLKTERDTPAMQAVVQHAFASWDGYGDCESFEAVFEHGQWWVLTREPEYAERWQRTFSVVDAEPGVKRSGIDFEEVS